MAELLVNVYQGRVLFVAENGHQWGRRESREVYDAEAQRLGAAPKTVARLVEPRKVYARDMFTGEVLRDGKGTPIMFDAVEVVAEVEVSVPPPDRLGIVRVPGPRAEYEFLLDELTIGGPRYILDLTPQQRSDVLARTVEMTTLPVVDVLNLSSSEGKIVAG